MKPNERARQRAPRRKPRRQPPQKFDNVPEKFLGDTAVLLATGPSLTKDQIEYIRPFHEQGLIRVFGLNDAYRICDFMDVLYACDPRWWDSNPKVHDNPCQEKWTQDKNWSAKNPGKGVRTVNGKGGQGLSKTKNLIHYGSNSGFQLLNLAWHYGIRKFLLLGYNMDVPRGEKQHFFGPHPKPLNQSNNYKGFVSQYNLIKPEDKERIINCTFPTALTCFQQKKLGDALPLSLLKEYQNGSRPEQETLGRPDTPDIQGEEGDNNRHRPIIDRERCSVYPEGTGE